MKPAFSINGRPVESTAFYAAACDPRRPVVIEACAGAGKTWMLVSRMLRALLEGAQPHEILAITFTKKAAAEMRERLNSWLDQFARAEPATRVHELRLRGCSEAQAQALEPALAGLADRVLGSARSVDIRTFHSWFSQLLRAAPLSLLQSLQLHPQAQFLEDAGELHAPLWRRFLRRVHAQPERVADLDALIRDHGRHQTQKWVMSVLGRRIEFELADAHGVVDASVPPPARLWPAFAGLAHPMDAVGDAAWRERLADLARELGQPGKSVAKKHEAAARLVQALACPANEDTWAGLRKALLTEAGEPRKQLGEGGVLAEAQDWACSIEAALEQQRAHDTHLRLARLARLLLDEYAQLKREQGVADMADLERCALHLLKDAQMSAWVQERLDARVRHLLIDEFQDTSPLQWHALHAWLSAYAGAGGAAPGAPSVFIVGDPKQSIYHFRGAEPRVFVAAQQLVREGLGGDVLSSDHTRRNAQAVIALVNQVFAGASSVDEAGVPFRTHTTESSQPGQVRALTVRGGAADEGPGGDAGAHAGPGGRGKNAGEVECWRDPLTQPRIEAEEHARMPESRGVADAIAELIGQGHEPGDIFVLGRKRRHLGHVAQALRERGIAYTTPQDTEVMGSPLVRDVVALLDALVSPAHDLSLAHALRSPVFGVGDEALQALAASAREHRCTWSAALQALASAAACAPSLRRAHALIQDWRAAARELPPHDLLDLVVAEGELRERYAAGLCEPARSLALEHLNALLAQALALDGGRYATPYGFVRALKQRALSMPTQPRRDAVQLLTVHGAKGLEARTVFVIDTQPAPERDDSATVLVHWPPREPVPRCMAFVASRKRGAPSLADVVEAERRVGEQEERNALYVALTRARDTLVLSHTPARGKTAAPWAAMLGGLRMEGWQPTPAPTASAPGVPQEVCVAVLPRLGDDAGTPRGAATATPSLSAADAARAALGQAVHRCLEWLTRWPLDEARQPARVARAVDTAAREFALDEAATQDVQATVNRVLHSPPLEPLLDSRRLIYADNEVSVSHEGGLLRIDRLVCCMAQGRRQWWVLDYKLHHAPAQLAAYREQLARYARAVQALQPCDEVVAAFVTARGELVVSEV